MKRHERWTKLEEREATRAAGLDALAFAERRVQIVRNNRYEGERHPHIYRTDMGRTARLVGIPVLREKADDHDLARVQAKILE